MLIVALIIVVAMIIIRYGGNYLNEKDVSASLTTIEEELNKEETLKSESLLELEFKGYKVEGIIEIPKINLKAPIAEGTEENTLNTKIGHFAETDLTLGNIGLAAHNRGYEYNYFGDLKKLKIDDALDAFGCHGIGGIWGGIATGIFTQKSINPVARWDGLIFGDYHLFVAQIVGIIITIAVAVVGTLICVAIVRVFTPLRVSVREEQVGLDISEHGESAYPSFNGLDQ